MSTAFLVPDFLRALLAGALFAAFALGAKTVGERLVPAARARSLPLWVFASLALYALVLLVTILELADVPMLVAGSLAILIFQAIGAFAFWRKRSLDPVAVVLFVIVAALWSFYTRDLAAIASHHDGITHTAFLLRFLDSGHLFLVKTPPAFAELWPHGGETLRHYPCGTHAIAAMFLWPWTKVFGIVSVASGFKAFAALIPALLAPMVYAAFKEPRRAALILVALLAATDPRFPVWALDSGGFSRAFGYLAMLPLVWAIAALPLPLIFGLCVPVAFALHPTSAMVLAIVATASFMLRPRTTATLAASLAVGLGLIYLQLRLTDSLGHAAAAIAADAQLYVPSWREIRAHVLTLYKVLLFEPADARLGPLAFTDALTLVGLLAFGRSRLPWLVFLGLTLVAASKFAPLFALNALGEVFYHNRERLTEAYFCMKPLIWLSALAVIERRLRLFPYRAPILAALATFCIADKVVAIRRTEAHLATQFATFASPRYATDEALMATIRRTTPPEAVFVYAPLTLDSLEARTGRRGFFMFQECPHLNDTESCRRRAAAFGRLADECPSQIEELRLVAASGAPLYLLLKTGTPVKSCAETTVETQASGFTLYRLRL